VVVVVFVVVVLTVILGISSLLRQNLSVKKMVVERVKN